jgi:transposase
MKISCSITDDEWAKITPLFPELAPRTELRGRPMVDTRAVFNAMLWVIQTGAPWKELPAGFPSHSTCHRRYKKWRDAGVLERIMVALYGKKGLCMAERVLRRERVQRAESVRPVLPTAPASNLQVTAAVAHFATWPANHFQRS